MVETVATIEGADVPVYQFILCDREKLEGHEQEIETKLADPRVCYNPFVDENGEATVYLAMPQTKHAILKSVGRRVAKFAMVATAGAVVFFSAKFGWKIWKTFMSMEEYMRYSSFIRKGKHLLRATGR